MLEKPEKRQVLLENIWKQLKEKGERSHWPWAICQAHTPHVYPSHTFLPGLTSEVGLHNTLLQVYMQNNHKFPPSEFMEKMREDSIVPNQVTGSNVTVRNILELTFSVLQRPHSTASFVPFPRSLSSLLSPSLPLSSPSGREPSCFFFRPTATRATCRGPCKL